MANICENNYVVFGDKDELVGLAKAIKANDRDGKYGHVSTLYNLLDTVGLNAEKIDCARAEFTFLDDKIYKAKTDPGKPETWSLQFDLDSAWCQPGEGIASLVNHFCKHDPVVYYSSVEPGCEVYETNDPDLLYDAYSVDTDNSIPGLETRIYDKEELVSAFQTLVPECKSDELDVLETAVKAKYPESYYSMHQYEDVQLGYGLDPGKSMPENSGVSLDWGKLKDKQDDFER